MSHIGAGNNSLLSFDDANSTTYRMLQLIQDDDGQPHFVEAGCTPSMLVQNTNGSVSEIGSSQAKVANQTSQGQLFVMMQPNDVNQSSTQRSLIPRPSNCSVTSVNVTSSRDERRKATHKEVERRRRDKINAWIEQLAKLIPDCHDDIKLNESKCTVLSKACDYITSLNEANESLAANDSDIVATSEQLAELRRQFTLLQEENRLLWTELNERGINAPVAHVASPIELD